MSKLSHAPQLLPTDSEAEIIKKAVAVKPSARQLAWHRYEFAAFLHFGINTFTDREWGEGTEKPEWFNPTEFDADQIVSLLAEAGMKLVILTCKHHDGFCLWPSAYTEHSVKNSPYKGDIVKEIADACRKYGLRFGVYLSPWDRHEATYGSGEPYNDYYINQLKELLTQYGEISDVWLDGACGEGPNGKRQVYDWRRLFQTVREMVPNATISSVGADVRWCGNEAGKARKEEWNIIPIVGTDEYLPEYSEQTANAVAHQPRVTDPDISSLEMLKVRAKNSERLYWYPSQVDVSIRPGWFYHAYEDAKVKSVQWLLDCYLSSVGGNCQLLLNIPPDRRGKIHEEDAFRLKTLGKILRQTFACNLLEKGEVTVPWGTGLEGLLKGTGYYSAGDHTDTYFEVTFPEEQEFDLVSIQENIANGQKIEQVTVSLWKEGKWEPAATAYVVGSRRIFRIDGAKAKKIRISVDRSRDIPEVVGLGIYKLPQLLEEPVIFRNQDEKVEIRAGEGAQITYTLDGTDPTKNGIPYTGPFELQGGGQVKVAAQYPEEALKDKIITYNGISTEVLSASRRGWKVVDTSKNELPGFSPNSLLEEENSHYVKAEGQQYSVTVDMGSEGRLQALLIDPVSKGDDYRSNCTAIKLSVSKNGTDWTTVLEQAALDNIFHNPILQTLYLKEPVAARFIKVETLSSLKEDKVSIAGVGAILC